MNNYIVAGGKRLERTKAAEGFAKSMELNGKKVLRFTREDVKISFRAKSCKRCMSNLAPGDKEYCQACKKVARYCPFVGFTVVNWHTVLGVELCSLCNVPVQPLE